MVVLPYTQVHSIVIIVVVVVFIIIIKLVSLRSYVSFSPFRIFCIGQVIIVFSPNVYCLQ